MIHVGALCEYGILKWHYINTDIITFRVTHSRGKLSIDHSRLCVCLCMPRRIPISHTTAYARIRM